MFYYVVYLGQNLHITRFIYIKARFRSTLTLLQFEETSQSSLKGFQRNRATLSCFSCIILRLRRINYQLKCINCVQQDIIFIGPISVIHCRSSAHIEFGDLLKKSAFGELAFEQLHLLAIVDYCLDNFKLVVLEKRLFGQSHLILWNTIVCTTASIVLKVCTRHNCRLSLKATQTSFCAVSQLLSHNWRRNSLSLATTSKDIRAFHKFALATTGKATRKSLSSRVVYTEKN